MTLKQLEINTRLWHIQEACEKVLPSIISFRNQLVHNYPHVEHDAVWLLLQTEVPALLQRVRALLAMPDSPQAE